MKEREEREKGRRERERERERETYTHTQDQTFTHKEETKNKKIPHCRHLLLRLPLFSHKQQRSQNTEIAQLLMQAPRHASMHAPAHGGLPPVPQCGGVNPIKVIRTKRVRARVVGGQ